MSIEKVSPCELFNRLIKSILTLQKEHGYKLCADFEDGVRKIADTLLWVEIEKENQRRQEWQRKNRKPLNLKIIEEPATKRAFRYFYPLFVLLFLCLTAFAAGTEYGKRVKKDPFGPVPIITAEEFQEMADRCRN